MSDRELEAVARKTFSAVFDLFGKGPGSHDAAIAVILSALKAQRCSKSK